MSGTGQTLSSVRHDNSSSPRQAAENLQSVRGVITPATIYVKAVIPAKAGIQNELNWLPDQVRHDILYVLLPEE
jgi:hypothetical protein